MRQPSALACSDPDRDTVAKITGFIALEPLRPALIQAAHANQCVRVQLRRLLLQSSDGLLLRRIKGKTARRAPRPSPKRTEEFVGFSDIRVRRVDLHGGGGALATRLRSTGAPVRQTHDRDQQEAKTQQAR